jgi:hypothetical protein
MRVDDMAGQYLPGPTLRNKEARDTVTKFDYIQRNFIAVRRCNLKLHETHVGGA